MAHKINLSNGLSYDGVLMVDRRFDYTGWVGVWGNRDGTGFVGTEGECSRKIFKTARACRRYLSAMSSIPESNIPIVRSNSTWDVVVERGYRLQYPDKTRSG
jgi:hypothetical protein